MDMRKNQSHSRGPPPPFAGYSIFFENTIEAHDTNYGILHIYSIYTVYITSKEYTVQSLRNSFSHLYMFSEHVFSCGSG
jgi:hypothetical protein